MILNFKVVNTGSTRLVLLIGGYAIKIPRGDDNSFGIFLGILRGWIGNRTEYMYTKYNIYSFTNPILFSFLFSLVVVQKRTELITREEFFSLERDDYPFGGFEWKLDSFGKIDNKIVVIDYGSN